MQPFRKIIAYTEVRDADAIAQVVELAARHGAALTLCDVISPPPNLPGADSAMTRLNQVSWRLAFDNLRSLYEKHKDRVDLNYTILVGEPFLAITEQVILDAYDLVVHISETGTGLNPTGMHLARKCPGSVWNLTPEAKQLPDKVVVAIDRDFSGKNRRAAALLAALINTASAVTQPGGTLNLVHAWQPYGENLLRHEQAGMTDAEARAYISAQARDHETWFDEQVREISARVPELDLCPHLLRGPVAPTLGGLAREVEAQLIIVGTIGTSVVPGILIGMSAEALLSSTSIPVLSVKPGEFVTPIEFSGAETINQAKVAAN